VKGGQMYSQFSYVLRATRAALPDDFVGFLCSAMSASVSRIEGGKLSFEPETRHFKVS